MYVMVTIAVCAIATVVGSIGGSSGTELRGDSGEPNELAGLAATIFAVIAFVLCVVAAIVCEVLVRGRNLESR